MTGIADLIVQFKAFGIFDFYLPFIIMFGILFTILTRTGIFGDATKKDASGKTARMVNLIVSLGGSLFIMGYTPVGVSLSAFFANFFGETFVVILTIIGLAMVGFVVTSLLPKTAKEKITSPAKAIAVLTVLSLLFIGVAIFFSSGGAAFFPGLSFPNIQFPSSPVTAISLPGLNISTTDLAILFLVVITGLIIYFVGIRGESGGQGQQGQHA